MLLRSLVICSIIFVHVSNTMLNAQSFSRLNLFGIRGTETSITMADVDNDGYLDATISRWNSSSSSRKFYHNNHDGTFTETITGFTRSVASPDDGIAWGDLNNDGLLDPLFSRAGNSPGTSGLFFNKGALQFGLSDLPAFQGMENGMVCMADFDNDGDADILYTGVPGSSAVIFRNDGKDQFQAIKIGIDPVYFGTVSVADYDKDGDIDILLAGWTETQMIARIYRNDGGLVFTDAQAGLAGSMHGAVRWGDYDADGFLDIVQTGYIDWVSKTRIYHNDGTGRYTPLKTDLIGAPYGEVAWGDFNNDGLLDIALMGTGSENFTKIFRNDGNGVFTDLQLGLWGESSNRLSCADYDNDHDLDIVSTGDCTHRNEIARKNTPPAAPFGFHSFIAQHTDSNTTVRVRWSRATDAETPSPGLTYNLRIGTTVGGCELLSPLANVATGFRDVAQMGNMSQDTTWSIQGLRRGHYSWSVQTIDNNFEGSQFGAESYFDVANHSPIFQAPPDSIVFSSMVSSFKVAATDMDRDTIVYSMSTDASFLTIDSLSGLISRKTGNYDSGHFLITVAASDGHGGRASQQIRLIELPVTGVAINDGTEDIPTGFTLEQNYPNPANPSTTIAFSLPSKSFVTLKIYDMLGKEVETLVNEEIPAGNYSRTWNAGSMPSAVYFYRLQAGAHAETKRLVLLK